MRDRFTFRLLGRYPSCWSVRDGTVVLGWVMRSKEEPGRKGAWLCHLYTDPTTEGRGRTKLAAVEDALRQVGGPD